eukprot:3298856-Rhodomonas_salina.3
MSETFERARRRDRSRHRSGDQSGAWCTAAFFVRTEHLTTRVQRSPSVQIGEITIKERLKLSMPCSLAHSSKPVVANCNNVTTLHNRILERVREMQYRSVLPEVEAMAQSAFRHRV